MRKQSRLLNQEFVRYYCLFVVGVLVPHAALPQRQGSGSGVIEGYIVGYLQTMSAVSVKVRAGDLTIEFAPDETTIIRGDITKTGRLVRVKYVDLQKNGEDAGYNAVPLRIDTISKVTMPNPTLSGLSVAPPVFVHVVAKPGLYLFISRCHACYYPDWHKRVAGLFAARGIAAVPGVPDWKSLKATPLQFYEHKKPEWTSDVLIGPVSDVKSLGRLILRLPEILDQELTMQQENRDLRRVYADTFQLGNFNIRVFPPTRPDFGTSWIYSPAVRVAFWVLCALLVFIPVCWFVRRGQGNNKRQT